MIKIDFTALSLSGASFIPATMEQFQAYKEWLNTEAKCRTCGAMYKDKDTELWASETHCGHCFRVAAMKKRLLPEALKLLGDD